MVKVPNPGSYEAQKLGCLCPVLDNSRGQGFKWTNEKGEKVTAFWVSDECPLHRNQGEDDEAD